MRFDQLLNKAKDALRGQKGQQLLDKAEQAASKATDGKYNDKIQKARNVADKAVGRDNGNPSGEGQPGGNHPGQPGQPPV